jgi:hypothetical protein
MRITPMKNLLVLFFFFVVSNFAFAQYKNNKWLMGYNTNLPFGGTKIEFENNQRTLSLDPRSMWFSACYTGISDKNDNWFIYSNGTAVCNKNHDTLINGNGLSPGGDRFGSLYGLQIPGQAVFLPFENENNLYLIHQNSKTTSPNHPSGNVPHSLDLFYSFVNPLVNNGQGAITLKNNLILGDTLEIGNILGVRHANGRDWWVMLKQFYYDIYYSILVTPDSLFSPISYSLGVPNSPHGGQSCFSNNGRFYAAYSNAQEHQLRLYDVNRCNGKLENYRQQFITNRTAGGVSFSPNSRYLYISSIDTLWQFDMDAPDIFASQTFIAAYDSFTVEQFGQPSATIFLYHWLAPDGKIYITSNVSTRILHVINNPDMPGQLCNFQQHSVDIPTYNLNTVPTPINYNLKQESGSPCDTLGVGLQQLKIKDLELQIFPNPSTGRFSMEYLPQAKSGMLYVYDMQGKEVYREYVSPYTSFKNLDLSAKLNNGMYALSLVFGNNRTTKTIVINKE